jgi:two-component system CheB/CheR fusion protein
MNPSDPHFEALLAYLKETRGFDFTGYKRSSLVRRVHRRMVQVGVGDSYPDYLDYLQVHQDEFTALFNTILINVTAFFRDPDAWASLRADVLEPMIAAMPPGSPLRIWSAGCASGEEAYTTAMVLADILGVEAFRERVKIYATDVDAEQLAEARQAVYGEREMQAVPPEFVQRYFEPLADKWIFRQDLRRCVIFGRNDLVQDAPISRIHLLTCRNTLMYLNAETQARILNRFHFALLDGGVLFLGKAEMLLSHTSLFTPIELKRRIFRRVSRQSLPHGNPATEAGTPLPAPVIGLDALRNEAFRTSPTAQLVLTSDGRVALTNQHLEDLFGVSSRDVGRPFRDLDVSFRPVELRKYVEQAQLERRTLRITDIEYGRGQTEITHLEIQVSPLTGTDGSLLGVNLIFQDVTLSRRLQEELEHANQQLEAAYEELQSTNEELETTNEELQSTVEELETTNEELQSTNEELETLNEELQSMNDELHVTNDELRDRTAEIAELNRFMQSILTSLRAAVIVIDRDMKVQVWNRTNEDLWGVRQEEAVGEHLLNLDIGLPADQVKSLVRDVLSDGDAPAEITVAAINRRGKPIDLRVTVDPLRPAGNGEAPGALLLLEPLG